MPVSIMDTELLTAVFDCWEAKEEPYLNGVIEEFTTTKGTPSSDGDHTIWFTKPASPPIDELKAMLSDSNKGEKTPEAHILDLLCKRAPFLTWFHNSSAEWAGAAGNDGRTDTSCVLVGNVLGAPHRRDTLLLGFMLVDPHNWYPGHAHAAHEAYHILAGEAWLSRGNSGLELKRGGDVIVHEPYTTHAMETRNSSVLVCWVNSGDLYGEYYFVGDHLKHSL